MVATLGNRNIFEALDFRIAQSIYWTGVVTTFAISPWANYDPISLPKMFTLAIGSFSIALLLLGSKTYLAEKSSRRVVVLSLIFLSLMLSSLLFSKVDLLSQFWGTFGRNTGLLTYSCLIVLMFATHLIQQVALYERIIFVFVFSSIPMTLYCLIQILGKDPVGWSEKFAFGTLGNVNFLSAYFGMISVCAISLAASGNYETRTRIILIILAIMDVTIAGYTKSIQGPIIFLAGLFIILFFVSLNLPKGTFRLWMLLGVSLTALLGFCGLIFSLLNKGPLATIVYQPSVTFRGDYMHAGYKMMLENPWIGVGLDNYGSWYREVRGEISTLRTGPNRISNSAHNVMLDLGSNGGFLLLTTYLLINLLVVASIVSLYRRGGLKNPVVVAASATWFAYQIQSTISINQIGIGVWGWILSGVLIGLSRTEIVESGKGSKERIKGLRKTRKVTQLQAKGPILIFSGAILGFTVALPPLTADAAYRTAIKTGNFERMYSATKKVGSTEFHKELLLDFAQKNSLNAEIWLVAQELTKRYPRNFYAWALMSVSPLGTIEERQIAKQKAQTLDPFNRDL